MTGQSAPRPATIQAQLIEVRQKAAWIEKSLLQSLHSENQAKNQVLKLKTLIRLQMLEKKLAAERLSSLEKTIIELEKQKGLLNEKIDGQKKHIHKLWIQAHFGAGLRGTGGQFQKLEEIDIPKRKMLGAMIGDSLTELEELRVDLNDAMELEGKILEEKQKLAFSAQEIEEQASLLQFNQQLQLDLIKKQHQVRLKQLDSFQKVKSAEFDLEKLIDGFRARAEFNRITENERDVFKEMKNTSFSRLKGKLPMPALGAIVSYFGKKYDDQSQLVIFKKGVEIQTRASDIVRAISAGKIVYNGELKGYGKVVLIDHGGELYSLLGQMGELIRNQGDSIKAGDEVGKSLSDGRPLYFEIRTKNIPVDPLLWVDASKEQKGNYAPKT